MKSPYISSTPSQLNDSYTLQTQTRLLSLHKMSTAPMTLPPQWVICENKNAKPKSPEGYDYRLVRKWSCCGTLGCIFLCPIEFVANLLPCNDAPQGTSCDGVCMDWWHLQKIVGQLLSDRDVGKVCLGVTDDGYEARVIIATREGGKKGQEVYRRLISHAVITLNGQQCPMDDSVPS